MKGLTPTNSLNVVAEHLFPELEAAFSKLVIPPKEILLSQAAAKASIVDHIAIACNCPKKCLKRCPCVKNSKKCSQYCHKAEFDCDNQPNTILKLTDAQLIPRANYIDSVKALKRKRATTTSSSSKPSTKKSTSARTGPSSATPLTTRARAKKMDIMELNSDGQQTMSQFATFAPVAHRLTEMVNRQAESPSEFPDADPTTQSTLSQFQPFVPLAQRDTTTTEQLAKKKGGGSSQAGGRKKKKV